jgi:DNA-binding winged helix-turn-helix (wHTH) protein
MPPREYACLRALQQHRGVPISAVALEKEVVIDWRFKAPGESVRLTLNHLKKRLTHAGLPGDRLIRNAYGRGYYWVEPGQETVFRD